MEINTDLLYQKYQDSRYQDRIKKLAADTKQEKDDQRLKMVASEFTAILLKQMFKAMRSTVPENDFIKKGLAEDVFTDLHDDEISKLGATQQEFNNLSQLLYQQLKEKE